MPLSPSDNRVGTLPPLSPLSHKVGFISNQLIGFIPSAILGKKTPEQWETAIFAKHAELTAPREEAADLYCAKLAERDYYGCAFYGVSQSFSKKIPKRLLLGISCSGMYVASFAFVLVLPCLHVSLCW